jgi:hypothetical protein
MRSVVLLSLLILALGAGSVFATMSSGPPARVTSKRPSAPRPISGGSTVGPNGAISGGTIKRTSKIKPTRKIKQRHRATRKHVKKS